MFHWRPRTSVAATMVLSVGLVLASAEAGAVVPDPGRRHRGRGLHRYRARFIPLPRLAETLRGAVVTVDLAVDA
jgi:hypothetical protein